jgi:hypothetical protein
LTAINILVQADSVHLVSDGASYGAEGLLVSAGPKVFPLPHISAAIGTRGPAIALPLLAHFIGHGATSYDGLKADIADLLRSALAQIEEVLALCTMGARFEVVIGGFSETTGPDAYMIACDADGVVSSITEIPELGFMPSSIPELDDLVTFAAMQRQARTMLSQHCPDFPSSIGEFDPEEFGLRAIEIQRAAKFDDLCGVGAFAQITSVRASGIETKILRRWPDQIGKPLNDNINTATSGVIGALAVQSVNIGDNAVTVPTVATVGSFVGTGSAATIFNFNLSVDTTGLSGKTFAVYVICNCTCGFSAINIAHAAALFINGTNVQSMNFTSGQFFILSGTASLTATGGVMTIPVTMNWNSPNTGTLGASTCFAMAVKR